MLLCDDEPSPESSDQVFFFCDEQANNINNKCDDSKDSKDNNKIINNKSYSKSSSIDQSVIKSDSNQVVIINNNKQKVNKNSHVFNRKRNNNKKCVDNITITTTNKTTDVTAPDDNDDDDDEVNQNLTNKPIGLETSITNDAATKTQNEATQTNNKTVLVKIQVENCCQCPDNSISFISQEKETSPVTDNDSLCKINKKNKTVAVQVNFNSIDSVGESNCLKISKVRCCNKATQRVQSLNWGNWGNKCNEIDDNDINSWSGKNMKNQSTNAGTGVICVNTGDNKPKLHDKSNSVDRASIKSKKFSNAVSPLKQFNRSSLTIGPDKITINQNLHSYNNIRPNYPANLSKYSPCASRLAASSKILGNTSPTALSPDSPLHGARPKSPRLGDSLSNSNSPKSGEKVTLQASLSLNINQLKKPNTTPRSRSVGDSCVTSPTSEATTLSYSPTGTEIISLDEIGQHHRHHHHHQQQQHQQRYKHKHQRSSSVSLSAPDLKALHTDRLSMPIDIRKANLETKC